MTLADYLCAFTGTNCALLEVDDTIMLTLGGMFGDISLSQAADAGTMLGELAEVAQGAEAILSHAQSETDPSLTPWQFMAWLNGCNGSVNIGQRISLHNPEYGTRAALGGMKVALIGPNFQFVTDAFDGLDYIKAFASTAYLAAVEASEWLDARATYALEVPELIMAQASSIVLHECRASFGLCVEPATADMQTALLEVVWQWGTSSGTRSYPEKLLVWVMVEADCLPQLLRAIGNIMVNSLSTNCVLLDHSAAVEHGLLAKGL